jgi:ATP-dependent Clp protease ATP-binding subunit ClpC
MMNNYNIERICTSSAEKALVLAREEARTLGHKVDARHLMLGLLKEGKGIGAKHLNHMNVKAEAVRKLVDDVPLRSPAFPTNGVEQYIERAFEECTRLGHEFIGSEHLLLSILDDGDNCEIFRRLNVNPAAARTNLLHLLGS